MYAFAILFALFCSVRGSVEDEVFVNSLASNIEKSGLLPDFAESWRSHVDSWRDHHHHHHRDANDTGNGTWPAPVGFNCNVSAENNESAHSVHLLHPQHISIIGAMGASIVAGVGADAARFLETTLQYRGIAFPIGGDGNLSNTVTLPNILEEYNSYLLGASRSIAPAWFEELARLNVAIPGSRAKDMEDQAKELIKRIERIPGYQFQWKLVTIFVGMNDLCEACDRRVGGKASSFRRHIQGALDKLRKDLTRTLVNLVSLPPMHQWYRQLHDDPVCWAIHRYLCPCIADHNTDFIASEYNAELNTLASLYRDYDFAVVVQPFMSGQVTFPKININGTDKTDQSLFAPDCFHLSRKGHAAAASALWTNLFQPIGEKTNTFDASQHDLTCPDANCPYLRTWLNSANCSVPKINPLSTVLPIIENLTSELWGNLTDNTTHTPQLDFSTRSFSWSPFTWPSHFSTPIPHWNWTAWTLPDQFWNVTLKPSDRPVLRAMVPSGSGWGTGYSSASTGWIAFGILLGLVVAVTGIIGYVDLKKRQSRRAGSDERTPLLQTGSNVDPIF